MKQRGISTILVVILVLIIFGLVGFFIYSNMNSGQVSTDSTPAPISQDESTQSIQTELENTSSGSIEVEFSEIDSEASSL